MADTPAFWEGPSMVKPLRLSSAIPSLDENVTCVGYPMGAIVSFIKCNVSD